jgi:hypothetical protein
VDGVGGALLEMERNNVSESRYVGRHLLKAMLRAVGRHLLKAMLRAVGRHLLKAMLRAVGRHLLKAHCCVLNLPKGPRAKHTVNVIAGFYRRSEA